MYEVVIKPLTENKRVIPLLYRMDELWTTNIKLPDLIVKNNESSNVQVMALEIVGFCDEKEAIKLMLHEDEISTSIKEIMPLIHSKVKAGKQKLGDNVFGVIQLTDEKLTDQLEMSPNECTVIPLSNMLFLNYTGKKAIDAIQFNVLVKGGLGEQAISNQIKLQHYTNKTNYIFPLKGRLTICNLPMSTNNHRGCLAQEFAFDVIGQNDAESLFSGNIYDHITKYDIFHKDVVAIGDGVVIDIGDQFPESTVSNPKECTDEYILKLFTELAPKIGYVNTLSGNYVTIDHENGEFSFYAHLSEATICVKKGDRVKQGDVIGKVGNTGHSDAPHLHFQLMDTSNMLKANGLPIMFENINCNLYHPNLTQANSFTCSDLMYVDIR